MASGYALFDGTVGSEIVTPDHATLDITGDIDIRALIELPVWVPAPGVDRTIVSKWLTSDAAGASYKLLVNNELGGAGMRLFWWDTVTGEHDANSIDLPGTDGAPLWIRAILDVDDGAGGALVRFYTSIDSPETDPSSVSWTQLDTDGEYGTVQIINSTASPVALGSTNAGASDVFLGQMLYVEIRNGINGTIVADPDFRDADQKTGDSPTTFTDSTGKVWTFDTAVWVPPSGGGRRKTRPPRNPRRYQV